MNYDRESAESEARPISTAEIQVQFPRTLFTNLTGYTIICTHTSILVLAKLNNNLKTKKKNIILLQNLFFYRYLSKKVQN